MGPIKQIEEKDGERLTKVFWVFWVNLLACTPKVSSGTTAYRSEGETKIEAATHHHNFQPY